jgi:hypothetical protein
VSTFQDVKYERLKRRYRGGDDVESRLAGFESFCADQIKIRHPEKGLIRFVLRDPQVETAQAYLENKQNIILKARQIGFTTLTMVFSMWEAIFRPYYSFINLSKREIDAIAALSMADTAWEHIDPLLKARLPRRVDDNQKVITWDNGSYMESHASSNNPARSRTVSRIVLDEYGFMPDPEEAWSAIEPTFDVGGAVVILSTANGMGNDYHTKWVKAYSGDESSMHPIFYPWSALPERDQAWYDQKAKDLEPWQLHQEYPSTPEEAFIKSGNPVFNTEKLLEIVPQDPWRGNLAGPENQWRGVSVEHEPENGFLRVYQWPQPYTSYVVGCDVAQGLEWGDFSSAHVIRTDTLEVVAHWHGHIDPDLFGLETCRLAAFYNMALLGTEVNNHGLTTVKAQQRFFYPHLFARVLQTNRYGDTPTTEIGFFTSAVTKPRIIDELAATIREKTLGLWDKPTITELTQYVRDPKGKMMGSPFDDRVMSLAIAYMLVPHALGAQAKPETEPDTWTMAWWSNQATAKPTQVEAPIGARNVREGVAQPRQLYW